MSPPDSVTPPVKMVPARRVGDAAERRERATRVKRLFRQRNVTTEALAEHAGLSRTTFSCIINGKTRQTRRNLMACLSVMTLEEIDALGHLAEWRRVNPLAARSQPESSRSA